jgi:hypothetical protein
MRQYLTILAMLILAASCASAMPPIAAEYYGTLSDGSNVSIYDDEGNMCGSGLVREGGQFGFISCNGDDISTENDEGPLQGENVTIFIDGTRAGEAQWFEGSINHLQLNPVKMNATLPGAFMLSLIPVMVIIAGYFYVNRRT